MLKNITLSADEKLIQKARRKAQEQNTTLNATFRKWLRQYVRNTTKTTDFFEFMNSMKYAVPGKHFTREELNER
jgi:hypothetical protein